MSNPAPRLKETDRPLLASGFRLQWETAQISHVLLYPEGMIKLNASAAEILKRCDGTRTLAALVGEIELAFDNSNLGHEVRAFISNALDSRWLRLKS